MSAKGSALEEVKEIVGKAPRWNEAKQYTFYDSDGKKVVDTLGTELELETQIAQVKKKAKIVTLTCCTDHPIDSLSQQLRCRFRGRRI